MGAHSNYITIERDMYTALVFAGIIVLVILIIYIIGKVEDYIVTRKYQVECMKRMDALQEKESRERAVDNFYKLNIDMEMDEMLEKEGLL